MATLLTVSITINVTDPAAVYAYARRRLEDGGCDDVYDLIGTPDEPDIVGSVLEAMSPESPPLDFGLEIIAAQRVGVGDEEEG